MALDIIARAAALQASTRAAEALALAGTGGGGGTAIETFDTLSERPVPAAIRTVQTSGHSIVGAGGAFYVNDDRATATLAAAHPTFCRAAPDGRHFRLLPDGEGLIPLSAAGVFGTAGVDHSVNHQPGIQAALDYARAIGACGIRADARHYSLWTPLRTPTSIGTEIHDDLSGHPIIIHTNTVMQAAPGGTTFHRRSPNGGDPAVFANTQRIDSGNTTNTNGGRYWRGGMIFLRGVPSVNGNRPADYDALAGLTLAGTWQLLGGLPMSGDPGVVNGANYYELNPDGSGWDILDKGIWFENDRHTGDLVFDGDITIDGFRGEIIYQGGGTHGSIIQKSGRLRLSNTDADGFNPGPTYSRAGHGTVRIADVTISNAWQALEGWLGADGLLAGVIENCPGESAIQGGKFRAGTYSTYYAPGRFAADRLPMCALDLTIRKSGAFCVGSYLTGQLRTFDTAVKIGAPIVFADGIESTFLDNVEVYADQGNMPIAVSLGAGDPAGSQLVRDVRVGRLKVGRTRNAIDAGYTVTQSLAWSGEASYGMRVLFDEVELDATRSPQRSNLNNPPAYRPVIGRIRHVGNSPNNWTNCSHNLETDNTIEITGPIIRLVRTTANTTHTGTLMNGFTQRGERVTLLNGYTDSAFCIEPTNTRNTVRMSIGPNDQATFEWDGSWTLVEKPRPLKGSATLDVESLAPGKASAEYTITVLGAKTGQDVQLVLPVNVGDLGALFPVARITADNQVKFRLYNHGDTTIDPPSASYTAVVSGW